VFNVTREFTPRW